MTHTLLIAVHALSGTVAFGCGVLALRRVRWFPAYYASMWVMAGSVAGAVAVGWSGLGGVTRGVFLGLLALAAAMVWRAELARRLVLRGGHPSAATVGHIGFTLVGLADAFIVVTVLNLGAPGAVVLVAALGVAAAGHVAISRAQRRLVSVSSR